MANKKIVIVHDYFYQFGGAEKVVETWAEMYPEARIVTSIFIPQGFLSSPALMKAWEEGRIKTSWLQLLMNNSLALKFFKHLFWIYPLVMSFMVVRGAEVVLISSTYCGKNARIAGNPKVIHYCHSPTRYLHGLIRETDLNTISSILRSLIPLFTFWLRWLDLRAVAYLNKKNCQWVANSDFIKATIKQVYHTDSIVIYPPIDISRFGGVQREVEGDNPFYFYFGRISFHKKVELIVQACLSTKKRLVIAGKAGFQPEMDKLRQIVKDTQDVNPQSKGLITIIDERLSDEEIAKYLKSCKAFIFPAKEDSGMIPVEVMSSGTPVIAFGAGGALEYVISGLNGILFSEQSEDGIIEGLQEFEKIKFDSQVIKDSVQKFRRDVFESSINKLVEG